MTKALLAMIVWAPFYIVPTAMACFVARYFFRAQPRPHLVLADWLLFFVPWFVWFAALVANEHQKSLSNLAEAYVLIIAAVAGFVIRLLLGPRFGARRAGFAVLCVVCVVGLALAAFVPPLPE